MAGAGPQGDAQGRRLVFLRDRASHAAGERLRQRPAPALGSRPGCSWLAAPFETPLPLRRRSL
eukprot:5219707-Prymnesium_polylepis.2